LEKTSELEHYFKFRSESCLFCGQFYAQLIGHDNSDSKGEGYELDGRPECNLSTAAGDFSFLEYVRNGSETNPAF
jgi:hypothetical protein